MDHPTPFAQGCPDNTAGGMYLSSKKIPASLENIASRGDVSSDQLGPYPDPHLPQGWKSVGPQWGPLEMAKELGCPPIQDEENIEESNSTEVSDIPIKRQFNENDLNLKFQPREEFGGRRVGYVFRMGAQGLGYYEDLYGTDQTTTPSTLESVARDTESQT